MVYIFTVAKLNIAAAKHTECTGLGEALLKHTPTSRWVRKVGIHVAGGIGGLQLSH